MKRVIDISEVLGTIELPEGACEVCVTGCADYDEGKARLAVRLDSFLRTTNLRTKEKQFSADWLPKAEVVTESVGPDETPELARDIFHRWVRKVREAVPPIHSPTS